MRLIRKKGLEEMKKSGLIDSLGYYDYDGFSLISQLGVDAIK
jgi:hypothetical protein